MKISEFAIAHAVADPPTDVPVVQGIDYIELYVGNVVHASQFYRSTFGLTPVAKIGLETGSRDRVSVALQQGGVRLLVTSALGPDDAISDAVRRHGDTVGDIALAVEDAAAAFEYAVSRGARPIHEPTMSEDEGGCVVRGTIGGAGHVVHSLIERRAYSGPFLPGFQPVIGGPPSRRPLFRAIDHVAMCFERGTLDRWTAFYQETLGFTRIHQEDTTTEYSGMRSVVVQHGDVRFPLLEPSEGRRTSQIEEYLRFHGGPGAQHIALLTGDIAASVRTLRDEGVEFLRPPATYYELLPARIGAVDEDLAGLQALGILLDRDEWGYLLQIFTRPVQSRPTLFFEIIQRKSARGFGSGNIRALFQAVELEQARRGTL
jgi:4-hydroxyphenylpyruvate dioxygenase